MSDCSDANDEIINKAEALLDQGHAEEAKALLKPLAERDVPEAILFLGSISNEDETEEAFDARYARAIERAASLNHPGAIHQLGVLYDTGDCGYDQDPDRASLLFKKAADAGHAHSQWIHACDLLAGHYGFDQDQDKGIALMEQAASNGSAEAHMTIAAWHDNGRYGYEKDMAQRDALSKQALALDDTIFDPWEAMVNVDGYAIRRSMLETYLEDREQLAERLMRLMQQKGLKTERRWAGSEDGEAVLGLNAKGSIVAWMHLDPDSIDDAKGHDDVHLWQIIQSK